MKKQSLTTKQERKMKFAEAGILGVLVLALAIFVGVRLNTDEAPIAEEAQATVESMEAESSAIDPIELAVVETEPVETIEVAVASDIQAEDHEATADSTVSEEIEPVTYAAAEQAYMSGDYGLAADMFTRYTSEHGANAWGFYMLGLSQWKDGELEPAEDAFLAALDRKPEHLKSLVNYSRVLIAQDRNEEAQAQIEMALAVNPESREAARVLGRIQHNLGLLAEAEGTYREVLTTSENDVWALNNLGLVLIEQDRHIEAMAPLAKAVTLDGDIACIQNNLGIALEHAGQYNAAGEAYAKALLADDQYTKAINSLARVEGLTQDIDLIPVDLALLADSFRPVLAQVETDIEATEADMEVTELDVAELDVPDMEVASAMESTTPENDEPEKEGSRNR